MSTYKAIISYDGRLYKGFQKQPGKVTIQGELERTLSYLLGEKIHIHGAGRTDAGVSAAGQVISFKRNKPIADLNKAKYVWNRLLPSDIYCRFFEAVPDDFDARHSAIKKVYSYSFSYRDRNPLHPFVAPLQVKGFDYPLFVKAMGIYEGKHDFKNFTTKKEDKDSFIRELSILSIEEQDGVVKVRLMSNGFMTYMVRMLIASAWKVAIKKFSLEFLQNHLDSEDRDILSFKSDPRGLLLEEVIYDE